MKKQMIILFWLFLFYPLSLLADDASTYTQSKDKLKLMTPATAIQLLQEGNVRFVSGNIKNRNLLQQAKLTKKSQYPFAFILSCMDSRGSPELIFDQGIGDIFVGRVAGNVVGDDQLGSMEYATNVVGSHIIVVMGHTGCGAVKGACENTTLGNLTQLLDKITPAVDTVKQTLKKTSLNCSDPAVINEIAKQNVRNMIQDIKKRSPLITELINKKQVVVIGGLHDLGTGRVTFFE